jgi:hypothetical protein
MPERNFIMEFFRIRSIYRIYLIIKCLYPLLVVCAPIVIILIFSGQISSSYDILLVLFILAGLVWLFFDIRKVIRVSRFNVAISDEFIRVGGVEKKWASIRSAEHLQPTGMMKPIILLHTDEDLKIPAAMDGLPYIRASIEKHVGS